MAFGGSARTLVVGLGFAAGVVILLVAPVGAGDDGRDRSTPRSELQRLAVVEVQPHPGPGAAQAYLAELDPGDPEELLRRGQAICALMRRLQAASGGREAVAVEAGGDTGAVVRAAQRHLCPELRQPR